MPNLAIMGLKQHPSAVAIAARLWDGGLNSNCL